MSRPRFLRIGVTIACFMVACTTPDSSDVLMMCVKTDAIMSMFSLSRFVGIGSRVQDFADDCKTIPLMSAVVASVNSENCEVWW